MSLMTYQAFVMTTKKSTYGEKLQNIADVVNSTPGVTWRAKVNDRFANLTEEQVKASLGFIAVDMDTIDANNYEIPAGVNAPDTFTPKDKWPKCENLTKAWDQSECGSCWAFGTVGAATDRHCIASGQTDNTRLSVTQLLGCCVLCGFGCNGGFLPQAAHYVVHHGLVSGGEHGTTNNCTAYPFHKCHHHGPDHTELYPQCGPSQKTPKCQKRCQESSGKVFKDDKIKAKTSYAVRGEEKMKTALFDKGPITVAFTVYEDFVDYDGGIYSHVTGKQLGGHAVRAVGYGEENGQKYWVIMNSWNETWGEDGTFRIKRGHNECGIERQGFAVEF